MSICTAESHSRKKTESQWPLQTYIGTQKSETGELPVWQLELRNCSCGSTLAKWIGEEPLDGA